MANPNLVGVMPKCGITGVPWAFHLGGSGTFLGTESFSQVLLLCCKSSFLRVCPTSKDLNKPQSYTLLAWGADLLF